MPSRARDGIGGLAAAGTEHDQRRVAGLIEIEGFERAFQPASGQDEDGVRMPERVFVLEVSTALEE